MPRIVGTSPRNGRRVAGVMIVGLSMLVSCSSSDGEDGAESSTGDGDLCAGFEALGPASESIQTQIAGIDVGEGVAADGTVDEAGAEAAEEAAEEFETIVDEAIGAYDDLVERADGELADDLTVIADSSEELLDGITQLLRDVEPGMTQLQLSEDLLEVVSDIDPELEGATERVAAFSLDECGVDFAEL
ncbi:MAG: hypothetical protein ABJH68_08275 [Ilumatobacter sp.]|uniref:hypothetical protein n=2 Tax=Ilumatobacter sp. TaxID=1967498 RepID=UPI00329870E2